MKNKYEFCWMEGVLFKMGKGVYRKDKNQNERKKNEFKSFNNLMEKFKESLKM